MAGTTNFDEIYRFIDGQTRLNAPELNSRFMNLHLRLNALEEKGTTWDALVDEGLAVALNRINNAVNPYIEEVSEALDTIETRLAQVEAGVSADFITDSATRVLLTPAQRAAIAANTAAIEATNTALSAQGASIGAITAKSWYLGG